MFFFLPFLQIPDVRTGEEIIDAVVVDEDSIGQEGRGTGAKILFGKGALDRYLSEHKLKDREVNALWEEVIKFDFHCITPPS